MAEICYIAIGTNLGDRWAAIDHALAALDALEGVGGLACSPIIETDPVGPGDQGAYLNGVIRCESTLGAGALLDVLLAIEASLGRDRTAEERWGPRVLDLDLLLHGDSVIREPGLVVPHPRMHERAFVLEPLTAIAPDVRIPTLGRSASDLLADLRSGV